jgi:hypothetical protein
MMSESDIGGNHVFKKGDEVQTLFDTGAFGCTILYGYVIAAGPKAYRVRWESENTNRVRQGDPRVKARREHNF